MKESRREIIPLIIKPYKNDIFCVGFEEEQQQLFLWVLKKLKVEEEG